MKNQASPRKKLRVAHVTTVDLSLRLLLLNQLLSLREAGYDVTGVSAPGEHVRHLDQAGIRHIAVPMTRRLTPLADLVALGKLAHTFRRERFDIVHTHTPKAGLLGALAARFTGVPVVISTIHGFYFHGMRGPKKALFVLMDRIAAACADGILSQSQEDLETAEREHIGRPDKVRHLGNGIDLRRFSRARLSDGHQAALRASLGIAPEDRVVGFVGRLVAEKGLPELFEAVAAIRARVPRLRFLVIGPEEPEKRDRLDATRARELGIDDITVFAGFRDDMPELYALMDVFVLPSHREGFPRSAMEASAMSVPSVVTDVRGCREAVDHEVNGLRVPVRDPAALGAAIERLLTDEPLRAKLAGRARPVAEARFDEQEIFRRVRAEYDRQLERRRKLGLRIAKRTLDASAALVGLAVTGPLLGVLAVLIRKKLGSPVLFRQKRPGLHGAPFLLMKFRTMTDERDAEGRLLPDEQRLTPFGKWLRRTSLDELPTLLNVLKGEMSLVGPRPLLMQYLERYSPTQARRHDVKPGVTGWAQVHGRNALSWDEKFALDVWYVDHQSFWLDLRILLSTLGAVLGQRGVSAAGHATMPEFMGAAPSPESAEAP